MGILVIPLVFRLVSIFFGPRLWISGLVYSLNCALRVFIGTSCSSVMVTHCVYFWQFYVFFFRLALSFLFSSLVIYPLLSSHTSYLSHFFIPHVHFLYNLFIYSNRKLIPLLFSADTTRAYSKLLSLHTQGTSEQPIKRSILFDMTQWLLCLYILLLYTILVMYRYRERGMAI